MILHRPARNPRDRNWTAISIGFVLPVLGVLLGIQAANWNEALPTRDKADAQRRKKPGIARLFRFSEARVDQRSRATRSPVRRNSTVLRSAWSISVRSRNW